MAYINFDPKDYIDEIETSELLKELKRRRIEFDLPNNDEENREPHIPMNYEGRKLKILICNFLGISHLAPNYELLETLRQRL